MKNLYEIKSQNEYSKLRLNATISLTEKDENGRYKYKKDLLKLIPINGMDLFYACVALGSKINNYVQIKFDKNYYLEFQGYGSYFAYDNIDGIIKEQIKENEKTEEFKEMWKNMSQEERNKWSDGYKF